MLTKPDIDEKTLKNITLVLFVIAVICAASAATQYTAAKLGYQDALYWSICDFGSWKLYNPFAVFAWNGDYRREAPVLFINAYSIFGISTVVATMILVFIRLLFHKKTTDNYGSARFATRPEMEAGHLLDGRGIILGLTDDGYYLRDDEKTHDFYAPLPAAAKAWALSYQRFYPGRIRCWWLMLRVKTLLLRQAAGRKWARLF